MAGFRGEVPAITRAFGRRAAWVRERRAALPARFRNHSERRAALPARIRNHSERRAALPARIRNHSARLLCRCPGKPGRERSGHARAGGAPVTDPQPFALLVLLTAAVGLIAVMSNRLTERVKIPSPAIVLAGAAIAVNVIPAWHSPPRQAVERVVTVALMFILFDGGMHIGWARFRSAAGSIATVGVAGTFLTVAAAAVFVHIAFGLAWYV